MPYCPSCHLERLETRRTCPIDGRYYRIARCPACSAEVAPTERFCVQCGHALGGAPPDEVVYLPRAAWHSRFLALLVDLLCVTYLATALVNVCEGLLAFLGPLRADATLVLIVAMPWIYLTVYEAQGRQTIGQQVLGIAVLRGDRRELDLAHSLLRAGVLYAGTAGAATGVLGCMATQWPQAAAALWNLGLGARCIPETAIGQAAHLMAGAALLLPMLAARRRPLHDVLADSEVFAVA